MQKSVCLSISFYNKQGICPFAQPSNSKDFDLKIVRNTVNSPKKLCCASIDVRLRP